MHQPNLSPVPDSGLYVLNEDYATEEYNTVVPAYFLTDGASIPVLARIFIYDPFHPLVMGPAINHDWGYHNHYLPRQEIDDIFYDQLIANGANRIKALAMYQAVRKFGGGYWDNDPEDIRKLNILYCLCKDSPRFNEYNFPVEAL